MAVFTLNISNSCKRLPLTFHVKFPNWSHIHATFLLNVTRLMRPSCLVDNPASPPSPWIHSFCSMVCSLLCHLLGSSRISHKTTGKAERTLLTPSATRTLSSLQRLEVCTQNKAHN
jgi:hypothetical protein